MGHPTRFADLMLEGDNLITPAGVMPLSEITRAEFVREVSGPQTGPSTTEVSAPAVVGGAAVGGVLFGTAGAIVGGLAGSTVTEEVPGAPRFQTNTVTIVFETSHLQYSMAVDRDDEVEANRFVHEVKKAVKHAN